MERLKRYIAENKAFVVVLLGAFIVRVTWLLIAQPTPVSDWHAYRQLAADLIDHGQFGYPERTSFYLPAHPSHLALWTLFSRSALWLGLSSVVLSTVSVALIHAIGVRLYANRRTAVIAAALFAFLPLFVLFSPVLATEHLFIVFMLSGLLGLVHLDAGRGVLATVGGVFVGLAILTRGEAVFYVPALVLFVWLGSGVPAAKERFRMTLLIGLGIVTYVMVRSYMVDSMLFQFGGLAIGAAVFLIGKRMQG